MKHILLIIMAITLTLSTETKATASTGIIPLETNGCTGWPEGNWKHCCDLHDILYWLGGGFSTRKKADQKLLQCVQDANGPAEIMYDGVRMFGADFWGAAWGPNKLENLTDEEAELVLSEQKLWKQLGQPLMFDFINYETALFRFLSKDDIALLQKEFNKYKTTSEYKMFINDFYNKTGKIPNIDKWIKEIR